MFSYIMKKIVGSQNERQIKKLSSVVAKINEFEPELINLPTTELRAKTDYFKEIIRNEVNGFDVENEEAYFQRLQDVMWEVLPEAFAVVREASRRTLGMRHFDVQLIGGIVLHQGKIAEMKTGEGKTLVAALSIYLNGISGRGAHLVTVNDYLARRDALWMGPIYKLLGLNVGVVNHDISYLVDWEDPDRVEHAIRNNHSVWPNEYTNGFDLPPERNLEVLTAFKTTLVECSRKQAYLADATYGTNNEFGFDYLRDNMKFSLEEYVQREHNYAIVDEVDSILIDEARTPLIISGPSEKSTQLYYDIDRIVRRLKKELDFTIDEKTRQVTLTEEGATRVEGMLNVSNIYDTINLELLHHVIQSLRAHHLFQNDVDYIVKENKVIIVDEFTGRLMPGRRWSDGLHQAIEAKEGVEIESENQTLATITIQNYFRMYDKLAGMTGTADTEAVEFKNIYSLDVAVIPTHKPMIRVDNNDSVYRTEREKFNAVVDEIKTLNKEGRPVLVGTTSIENSEKISKLLDKLKVNHQVLNAKQHEKEAEIVAQAGRIGAVTIATNMAGRGTDILLGGNPESLAKDIIRRKFHQTGLADVEPQQFEGAMLEAKAVCENEKKKVIELGGLHIIGTERHEARRVDNQLRGRSGRQGDPGSSRFFVSLEDSLMRIFASDRIASIMDRLRWEEGEPIEHKLITRAIENAQKQVEARNFDIRKHLLEYDDVLNKQRDVVYTKRKEILSGDSLKESVYEMSDELLESIVATYVPEKNSSHDLDLKELGEAVYRVFNVQVDFDGSSNGITRAGIFESLTEKIRGSYEDKENEIGSETLRQVEKYIMLQTLDYLWKDHLLSMDHLREGIGLRGYAQRDPLQEYKKEGYEIFSAMMDRFQEEVCQKLFRVRPVNEDEMERLERRRRVEQQRMILNRGESEEKRTPVKREKKIGRNDPCPCGSGKKYKKCCGVTAA